LGKDDLGYRSFEFGFETNDVWVDQFEHAGMEDHISYLQVCDDDLVKEQGT
jgi:hypothetical protein